jgi:hypothetical protein
VSRRFGSWLGVARVAVARPVAFAALAAFAASIGCGQPPPPPEANVPLDGAVARVGRAVLPSALVAEVAGARGVAAPEALEGLVRDALAAQGALDRGFGRDPAVSWQTTSALGRRVPEHLAREAVARGAPDDDELALVSVVHAVVLRSPVLREEDALELAGAIRQAVVGARDADDFRARVNRVNHPHAKVVAEPLGPFGADGRDSSGAQIDAGFVAAAFALRKPLETSPIVVSPFGWHVIQLVERKPAGAPSADRALELAPAVASLRARGALDDLLRERREHTRVELSGGADALMAQAFAAP